MTEDLTFLTLTAATIGLVHTLMGPDHYLPFIVLSRARGWSQGKTAAITFLCGLGHVLSSVVLGLVGIGLGVAVGRLEAVESWRGEVAAWLLITVGLVYFAWGLHRALRRKGHHHFHFPVGKKLHELTHHPERAVEEAGDSGSVSLTPWVLFIVFVLGPCEPLIPVLMYPAATASWWGVALVAGVFCAATLVAMMGAVWLGSLGLDLVPLGKLERYSHALAGAAIFLSGVAIRFLGL